MTKENAHEYLPLVQALADGKTVQVQGSDGNWYNTKLINTPPSRYRIKPEPRRWAMVLCLNNGFICQDTGGYNSEAWERITVQEVLK